MAIKIDRLAQFIYARASLQNVPATPWNEADASFHKLYIRLATAITTNAHTPCTAANLKKVMLTILDPKEMRSRYHDRVTDEHVARLIGDGIEDLIGSRV